MNLSAMYEKNEINLMVPNSLNIKKVEDYKNKTNYEEKNNKKKSNQDQEFFEKFQ